MFSCFCRACSVALRTFAPVSCASSAAIRSTKSTSGLAALPESIGPNISDTASGAGAGLPYLRSSCSRSIANKSGCSKASTSPRSAAASP